MKIKVAVLGASGRMGQEVLKVLSEYKDLEASLAVSRTQNVAGFLKSSSSLDDIKSVDVVIDFSLPETFNENVESCIKYKKPLVSGVTGLSLEQHKNLLKAGESIAVLWAPNMSLGVAVLNKTLQQLGDLKDYDFQIEETHHQHKKDKPSGTALHLQKTLEKSVGKKLPEPLAIRGGGVFGLHRIFVMGPEETLVFEHQALGRGVFARGAVRAAQWLVQQKQGIYKIEDIF